MTGNQELGWQFVEAAAKDAERVCRESFNDPDLANASAEYRAGYLHGFKEATLGFALDALRKRGIVLAVSRPPGAAAG
jgi:hypothetical protein